jgi:UDP-N-acetylmuramoylalanine--D-glutamate ligase
MAQVASLPAEWLAGEVAVIGLARSGQAAATLLARAGARVYASDAGTGDDVLRAAATLVSRGIAAEVGRHDLDRIARASLVVASPGVPPNAPPLAAARGAGVGVVSEIEIALRALPGLDYIGVTGTNGKTTTTSMIAALLGALGRDGIAVGNIGTPLSELALRPVPPAWAALELSSFQLHDTPSVQPRVGVLTNLSPNHLDRYESVDEYYADKALLFRNASLDSIWVTNGDDADVQRMAAGALGTHYHFSVGSKADAWVDWADGGLVVLGHRLLHRDELPLLGDHNVANALTAALAVAAASPAHREPDVFERMGEALRSFRALEHRIEPVAEVGGVAWINDSKSTNVASTLVALRGMRRPTVLLLGGKHKGEPYTELGDELRRTGRAVVAYGEAAGQVERDLAGVVPVERLGSSFDHVIERARALARPGDAVLLSPACSSYDMFDNYEHRGREFKRLALALNSQTH